MSEDTLFISHANPEDNDFTLWLAFQLVQAGYRVWTDITGLLGGEDFWKEAESTIRNPTIKFLYVLSRISNSKEGPLQELQIAKTVAKSKALHDFIIPLHTDDLPYSEVNVQLTRLKAIPFDIGWAGGLSQLLEKLDRDKVPRSQELSPTYVSRWWRQHIDSTRSIVTSPEPHISNMLAIKEAPSAVYRHIFNGFDKAIDAKLDLLSFPAYRQRKEIVTFAERDQLESELDSVISFEKSLKYVYPDFTVFGNEKLEQSLWEMRIALVRLLGLSWRTFLTKRRLPVYRLSRGTTCLFFTKGLVDQDKLHFSAMGHNSKWRAVVGFKTIGTASREKRKRYWHFGVSLSPRVHPVLGYFIKPHVLFSEEGAAIWENKESLHKARRSQCKDWWNDDWRDRLLATISWLSEGEDRITLLNNSASRLTLSTETLSFLSPVTYIGDVVTDEFARSESEDEESSDAVDDDTNQERVQ